MLSCAFIFNSFIMPFPFVAAALGGAALLGGITNAITGNHTNKTNARINRQNNEFNAREAQKQRDWQESMYNKYGTAQSKAAQLRAAGLNSQLAGVQPDAAPAQGAAATAASPISMQNTRPGDALTSAVQTGLDAYSTFSQTELNDSMKNLNKSQKELTDAESEFSKTKTKEMLERVQSLKYRNYYLNAVVDSQIAQQWNETQIARWNATNVEYQARNEMFKYYNLNDKQIQVIDSQILQNNMNAFKLMAEGKLALKDLEYYQRNFALRSAQAQAMLIGANASMLGANASMLTAQHQSSYLDSLSKQADEFTRDKKRMNDWLDGKAFKKGKKFTQFERLMTLNYSQSMATYKNLLQQPALIKSQIFRNYVQSTGSVVGDFVDGLYNLTDDSHGSRNQYQTNTSKPKGKPKGKPSGFKPRGGRK